MAKTTTDLDVLKINYLTQAQYESALSNEEINENELYITPSTRVSSEDMTAAEVNSFVNGLNVQTNALLDFFYPVGSYYETNDSNFNPNSVFGGTWSLVLDGIVSSKKLVWTNSSPSEVFTDQTIYINLSAYDEIEIVAKARSALADVSLVSQIFTKGANGTFIIIPINPQDSNANYETLRGVTITDSSVTFGAGGWHRWTSTENSLNNQNGYAIPMYIYGIKNIVQYKWQRTA